MRDDSDPGPTDADAAEHVAAENRPRDTPPGHRPPSGDMPPIPPQRDGMDAANHPDLDADPHHEDAKLDIGIDESFPASDPPAQTQPGKGLDPAPSSGFTSEAATPPPLDGE